MQAAQGERVLMRIHVGGDDQHGGIPLYQALVHLLRKRNFAGATVFRAVLGFGAEARIHHDNIMRLSNDMPYVVECIDTEEKINAILPELDGMIGGGVLTLERVRVILYRPNNAGETAR